MLLENTGYGTGVLHIVSLEKGVYIYIDHFWSGTGLILSGMASVTCSL